MLEEEKGRPASLVVVVLTGVIEWWWSTGFAQCGT
jgi:hypothetical protein